MTDVTDVSGTGGVPAARRPAEGGLVPAQPARRAGGELPTPFPLAALLPAVYQQDPFTLHLCAALDRVLAPVIATLDALPAYVDPRTTPADMLGWLGSWVGLALDGSWPEDRRRALVAAAARLHAARGTRRGLEEAVRLATGAPADVVESGSAVYALDPAAESPGAERPFLRVTVAAADVAGPGEQGLRALLALLVPAHVPWELVLR